MDTNNLLQYATLKQLQDQNSALPRLERIPTARQWIEFILGFATLLIFGIGLIFLIIFLIDCFCMKKYYVKNRKTGEKFYMEKSEYKKYKQFLKSESKKTKTFSDIQN